MASEIEVKTARLGEFLDNHHLDGVMLTLRSNFAWITAGKCNRIANNTPVGVATILATRDGKRVCLANRIEAPRFRDEELVGTGIEVVEFPWYDGAAGQKIVRELIGGRKIAGDSENFGLHLPQLPGDFTALRWELTPEEMEVGRAIFSMPAALCYLAIAATGQPAGGAAAAIRNGLATLFADSTVPAFRRSGVHRELIAARLNEAIALGCDLATASTLPGSGSQRNYERLGFEVVYTRVTMVG